VLVTVCRMVPARRVVAFTVNLVDDDGVSAADEASGLIARLGLRCDLVVVEPECTASRPPWSAHGPRFDALPEANAEVNARAATIGCRVLLSGNGADELLASGSFAGLQVLRRWGRQGAQRYLADVADTPQGRTGEAMAAVARLLTSTWSSRLYWAANWPDLCRPRVSDVLSARYRTSALAWAAGWVQRSINDHIGEARTWADADRTDTFWPRSFCPAAGAVPEASPFLHPRIVATGLAIPVADRYDPRPDVAYHRIKPQVVGLFPRELRSALPTSKQYYTRALARSVAAKRSVPVSAELGLLDADAVATTSDTAVLLQVAAVESWLAEAVGRGFTFTG
jgi:hypothetical protein